MHMQKIIIMIIYLPNQNRNLNHENNFYFNYDENLVKILNLRIIRLNDTLFEDVSFLFFIYRLPISYEIVFLIILKTCKEIIACLTIAIIGCLQTFFELRLICKLLSI